MTEKMKAPTANSKGEKHGSDYSADAAVREVFEKFYESLRQINVTMLKEGQAEEYAQRGRVLEYRMYDGTEYGTYFDVSDLRMADVPVFDALLSVFGFDGGEAAGYDND